MAVTLYVDRAAWFAHLGATWSAYPGIVPVVKGNGYGFGRERLARLAVDLGVDELAVGTVHEAAGIPPGPTVVVLTPALAHELVPLPDAVLTIGSERHLAAAVEAGFGGRVVVKLVSQMRRFGVATDELKGLLDAVDRAGLGVHAFGLHFPLATPSEQHARAVRHWLLRLPAGATLQASHVTPADLARLAAANPQVRIRARVGTALWHGDKAPLHLRADVLDRRSVGATEKVGYQLGGVPGAGQLVVVSGGTAHGVYPLAGGLSPFHFRRTRLALVEPPHMHTSMLFVPKGSPVPEVGEELDLQRPLTQTMVDRIVER